MNTNMDSIVDAMETLLSLLEAEDDVAYVEVGGVAATRTDAVVTEAGVRNANEFDESGVWCRAFTGGAAEYRYVTSFDEDHLEDVAGRIARAGRHLAQDVPARYDRGTIHRATHEGWAGPGDALDETPLAEKTDRLEDALAATTDEVPVDRTRLRYADAHETHLFMTTTGTSLRTVLDRASIGLTLDLADGPKVQGHAGATTGAAFLDAIPDHLATLAERGDRLGSLPSATPESGEREVVLSPTAAGQLVHELSHYFEIDAAYMGSSPYDVGDEIGPTDLTIEDRTRAGSWAARAYDAEGRPTEPVTVVDRGRLTTRFHNTASAAEEDVVPHGHAVGSLALDKPPRVHARHLDVEPGRASIDDLRDGADVYVERFDPGQLTHVATRTKRESQMPPSVLYAKRVAESTPSEFEDESERQGLRLPVAHGVTLDGGSPAGAFENGTIEFAPEDLLTLRGLSAVRETVTGTCTKHKSQLPVAATAPALRLRTTVENP